MHGTSSITFGVIIVVSIFLVGRFPVELIGVVVTLLVIFEGQVFFGSLPDETVMFSYTN